MKKSLFVISSLAFSGLILTSCNEGGHDHDHGSQAAAPALPASPTASPEGAKVYIVSPKNGAEVSSPVTVRFGLKGMGVAPAGVFVEGKATGHHHLVIDADTPNLKVPFPMDDKHLHYGGGQTEATLELAPGEHTLQLVLGDHFHVPHDPPVISEKITITVK